MSAPLNGNGVRPSDLLADDNRLPSFEGGESADTILVNDAVLSVALPAEVLDWCMMAEAYCSVGGYGRQLADRYIELYARASPGRRSFLEKMLEAVTLKKHLEKQFMGGFGGGGKQ